MRFVSLCVGPILVDFKSKTPDVLYHSLLYKMQIDIIFAMRIFYVEHYINFIHPVSYCICFTTFQLNSLQKSSKFQRSRN